MKFKQYLNEGRTKSSNLTDVLDIAHFNCKNYMKMLINSKKYSIYRGVESFGDYYGYIDSNKGRGRKSAYTRNYTTLLIDNLPSWKGWPKRSKGIVCSTDRDYAYDYGDIYYVIPFDNALVGVAPKEDIFVSFKFLKGEVVRQFNTWLFRLFELFEIKEPKTYNDLKKAFKHMYNTVHDDMESWKQFKPAIFKYNIFDSKDYMNRLDNLLNPNKNGFKMGVKNIKPNREVWIQGECLMVDEDEINTFLDGYKNGL